MNRTPRYLSVLPVLMFLFFYLSTTAAVAQESKGDEGASEAAKSYAVMHLTSSGLAEGIGGANLEQLLVRAIEANGQSCTSPDVVNQFLEGSEEEDFAECVSVACTARAGQALGVEKVVSGAVLKSGEAFKINLVLINTASAQTMAAYKVDISDEDRLVETLVMGVKELLEKAKANDGPVEAEIPGNGDELTPEQMKEKENRFYKGSLTTIGPLEIIPRNSRAGVITGYRRLAFNHYVHLEPQVDLRFFPDELSKDNKLRLGFGVPFNLQIFSGEDQNNDGEIDKFDVKLRSQDWDSWRDAFQIIRYIQYGRKEDNIYLNINRTFAASIGHGPVIKRYIPNLDYFTTRVSAEFDGYSKYGGGEIYTNDITKFNIIGVLLFLKPGSFFSDHWMAESFSLGFHYTTDWDAPWHVLTERANSDGSYIYDGADIHFFGADVELKIAKWPVEKPKVDIKTYFDFTNWLNNGSGITLGALGRFNLYTKIRQAFRVRLEFRAYQDNYTPAYFDPFYEIMKYNWFSQDRMPYNPNYTVNPRTKFQEFTNRPSDWNHFGGHVEFSYALLDYIAFTIGFDKASNGDNGNFLFHLEIPATKYFQIVGTYYKANFSSAANIFDFTSDNTMLVALARIRPVQILAFQVGIRKTVQASANYFPNLDSIWDVKADLDLSWEF